MIKLLFFIFILNIIIFLVNIILAFINNNWAAFGGWTCAIGWMILYFYQSYPKELKGMFTKTIKK